MTDQEYIKFFLKDEYYDIYDSIDSKMSEKFWKDTINYLDILLNKNPEYN